MKEGGCLAGEPSDKEFSRGFLVQCYLVIESVV